MMFMVPHFLPPNAAALYLICDVAVQVSMCGPL